MNWKKTNEKRMTVCVVANGNEQLTAELLSEWTRLQPPPPIFPLGAVFIASRPRGGEGPRLKNHVLVAGSLKKSYAHDALRSDDTYRLSKNIYKYPYGRGPGGNVRPRPPGHTCRRDRGAPKSCSGPSHTHTQFTSYIRYCRRLRDR